MAEGRLMDEETRSHRLILPRDANHYGTLYAGNLLSMALEAGYATAFRSAGGSPNLVLKRVLDLRCFEPVKVGVVAETRGREVCRARAMVVVALVGSPLPGRRGPWMDALMQFVPVGPDGRPEPIGGGRSTDDPATLDEPWEALRRRARTLLAVRLT